MTPVRTELGDAENIDWKLGVLVQRRPKMSLDEAFEISDRIVNRGHEASTRQLGVHHGVDLALLEPDAWIAVWASVPSHRDPPASGSSSRRRLAMSSTSSTKRCRSASCKPASETLRNSTPAVGWRLR